MKAKGQRNIAVIENEFGEVNIDNELVAENLVEKEDLVSLDNGGLRHLPCTHPAFPTMQLLQHAQHVTGCTCHPS